MPREAMSRRDVLKLAGAAVLASPVGRAVAEAGVQTPGAGRRPRKVIVAGGGSHRADRRPSGCVDT